MITLALPQPTVERHLARTIDGKSLTGIPGAWSHPIKRKPFRVRKHRLTPWQLDWLHNHCTGHVVCNNPPHPKTRLWTVVSSFEGGGVSVSHVWAHKKASAIARHQELMEAKNIAEDELLCVAYPIGGAK